MRLKERLKNLERLVAGAYTALVCAACGEKFCVAVDTGLEYVVWDWVRESAGSSYTPRRAMAPAIAS